MTKRHRPGRPRPLTTRPAGSLDDLDDRRRRRLETELADQVEALPTKILLELGSVSAANALDQLRLAVIVAEAAERSQRTHAQLAHQTGASWADVGRVLGTSRQAAWERYRLSEGDSGPDG